MKKITHFLLLAALVAVLLPRADAAGIVTDTLTVKVGYYGMTADKYVEAGTYHWTELSENLTQYETAYSFYRPTEEGDYRIVVDSARGIHIDELLEYARINTDDVQSVEFHTRDQDVGAFTSFTWNELFRPRYYFDNLPKHIELGDAWNYATEVKPMLALEDSWVTYDIGTENVYPNFTAMGTGNRFRLLFGQVTPTESRTNQTAKYTHTVYVTLRGTPKIVEEPEALEGTIGSHTASMTLSVDDPTLLEHLQELLQFTSSDGSVLQIDGWTVTPDSRYSDLVTVTIRYSVLKKGSASISGSIGGLTLETQPGVNEPEEPDDPEKPDDPGGGDTPGGSASDLPAQSGGESQTEPAAPAPEGMKIPLTAEQVKKLLAQGGSPEPDNTSGADSAPEEKKDDLRPVLLLTGAGALLLAAAGGLVQTAYYRKERKA